MTVTPSKNLIARIHDHAQAQAQHVLFKDDEHREEVEHTAKAAVMAVRSCAALGKANKEFRDIEDLNWHDFDHFEPGTP